MRVFSIVDQTEYISATVVDTDRVINNRYKQFRDTITDLLSVF